MSPSEIGTVDHLQRNQLRRKNIRTALLLGGLALFFFITSFPFWSGLFRMVGDQVQ